MKRFKAGIIQCSKKAELFEQEGKCQMQQLDTRSHLCTCGGRITPSFLTADSLRHLVRPPKGKSRPLLVKQLH
jgi:hypothetical protein